LQSVVKLTGTPKQNHRKYRHTRRNATAQLAIRTLLRTSSEGTAAPAHGPAMIPLVSVRSTASLSFEAHRRFHRDTCPPSCCASRVCAHLVEHSRRGSYKRAKFKRLATRVRGNVSLLHEREVPPVLPHTVIKASTGRPPFCTVTVRCQRTIARRLNGCMAGAPLRRASAPQHDPPHSDAPSEDLNATHSGVASTAKLAVGVEGEKQRVAAKRARRQLLPASLALVAPRGEPGDPDTDSPIAVVSWPVCTPLYLVPIDGVGVCS
jgi:hypothetical protein